MTQEINIETTTESLRAIMEAIWRMHAAVEVMRERPDDVALVRMLNDGVEAATNVAFDSVEKLAEMHGIQLRDPNGDDSDDACHSAFGDAFRKCIAA